MSNYSKIAEEEFQKLPLEEKEKLISVVQTWNKAFECGVLFALKNAKGNKKEIKENDSKAV